MPFLGHLLGSSWFGESASACTAPLRSRGPAGQPASSFHRLGCFSASSELSLDKAITLPVVRDYKHFRKFSPLPKSPCPSDKALPLYFNQYKGKNKANSSPVLLVGDKYSPARTGYSELSLSYS